MSDEPARVEDHRQAFAAALRVPDDADTMVQRTADGLDRLADRLAHGVVLVIAGQLLDEGERAVIEDDEAANDVEQARPIEHAAEQNIDLRLRERRDRDAVRGAPGGETLPVRGKRAEPRFQAIGDDQQLVPGEQVGRLLFVGFELMVRLANRGLGVGGVLQLDDGQRQPVDEHDHVGPPVGLRLAGRLVNDGELVDGEPVVVVRVVEVEEPDLVVSDPAVGAPTNSTSTPSVSRR